MLSRIRVPTLLLLGCSFCAAAICREPARAEPPAKSSIVEYLSLAATDRIEVSYAPKGRFPVDKRNRATITDAKLIAAWLAELGKIPAEGPGLKVKMLPNAPEYRIELFAQTKLLGTLRIMGTRLDAPAGDGWDFYTGGDKAFVKMVKQLFENRKQR